MKLHNLGRIFNPSEYGLIYAKSPQAVVFDNFVRVYFSDCKKDRDKLISYVCYADFNKEFNEILDLKKQIIPDGKIGTFDEHGIFPFSPMIIGDEIFAYTSGWTRRQSVSVDTGIGLARSFDGGKTFERVGNGPVLTASLYEPFLVIDGFVRKYNDKYYMWYIFGKEWKYFESSKVPERIYKIGYAESEDGIEWNKANRSIIRDVIEDESQALPTVIKKDECYHMFFCYRNSYDFRNNPNNGYRLGYARSKDLVTWDRKDEAFNVKDLKENWCENMQCYPNLFEMNGEVFLLYNGNMFGKTGFGIARVEDLDV